MRVAGPKGTEGHREPRRGDGGGGREDGGAQALNGASAPGVHSQPLLWVSAVPEDPTPFRALGDRGGGDTEDKGLRRLRARGLERRGRAAEAESHLCRCVPPRAPPSICSGSLASVSSGVAALGLRPGRAAQAQLWIPEEDTLATWQTPGGPADAPPLSATRVSFPPLARTAACPCARPVPGWRCTSPPFLAASTLGIPPPPSLSPSPPQAWLTPQASWPCAAVRLVLWSGQ